MSSRRSRYVVALARALSALAAVALLGGCGLGAGKAPGGVRLAVTRDFGAQTLRSANAPSVHGQETVMSLLERNATVTTRYGGGFVQSIDGHAGGHEAGEPVDWFYYVNGVEASQGAAARDVRSGDRIWWDLHDWGQTDYIPAVVGSFPEPFLHGPEGLRLPVRVECSEPDGTSCRTVSARLRRAGVPAVGRSTIQSGGGGQDILRLLVGTWAQIHREPGAQSLEQGPSASGVYAKLPADGKTLALLSPQGRAVRTLGAGAGLVAATRYSEQSPEWLVTGTDAAGVQRAADALDEADLHDRFAVAIAPGPSLSAGTVLALPTAGS